MVARFNRVSNESVKVNEPNGDETGASDTKEVKYSRESSVNYYKVREEEYTFPYPSFLDPLDSDQKNSVWTCIKTMLD